MQGGGAKGIAYVGIHDIVQETLKELKGKDAPIKTVIGSSAGSILGLAVCCGLNQE